MQGTRRRNSYRDIGAYRCIRHGTHNGPLAPEESPGSGRCSVQERRTEHCGAADAAARTFSVGVALVHLVGEESSRNRQERVWDRFNHPRITDFRSALFFAFLLSTSSFFSASENSTTRPSRPTSSSSMSPCVYRSVK